MGQKMPWGRSLILYLVCALLLLGISVVAQAQTENEKLYGAWIDETAKAEEYKWVFEPDGKAFRYWRESDQPYTEGRYFIDKKWTDENGNTFYRCSTRWAFQPYNESKIIGTWYILIRLDASGDSMYTVWSRRDYPADFDSGQQPLVHLRQ